MPGYDGAGNWTRSYNFVQDSANGINILATRFDTEFANVVNGFNNALTRDGQGKPATAMDWNGQNLTNVNVLATSGPATFAGNVNVAGNLTVGGSGTFSANETITGSLTVNGSATFARALKAVTAQPLVLSTIDAASAFQLIFSRSAAGVGGYYSVDVVEQGVGFRSLVLQPGGGFVGVGTPGPTATVDVAGTFRARGAVTLDTPLPLAQGGTGLTPATPAALLAAIGGLPASQAFGIIASSYATPGYVKFTGGFMVQFGTAIAQGDTSTSVVYPQPFTTFSVALVSGNSTPNNTAAQSSACVTSTSTTGFTFWTAEGTSSNTGPAWWIAVGR